MPRLLLAGATGHLGQALAAALKQRGWWIRALTRRLPDTLPHVDDVVHGDLRDAASLAGCCDDVDAVFSTAGASLALSPSWQSPTYWQVDFEGNRNLLREAERARVAAFGYVSVYATPAYADTAYVQAHAAFADLLRDSGMRPVILCPTGFFSAFDVFVRIARLGVAPLIGDGSARTNPIHVADLADVCAEALADDASVDLDVGGPDVWTRKEIFELAFQAVGKRPRFLPTPEALLTINRVLVRPVDPRLASLLAFFQRINQTDVVAPAHGSRRLDDYFRHLIVS